MVYMMKTTKCSTCGSVNQTWTEQRQPVATVTACQFCKGQSTAGQMNYTVDAYATRTQFAPATRPI